MRMETRRSGTAPRHLLFVAETKEESKLLDEFFGSTVVDDNGLIASIEGELRLSDGYGEHYIALKAIPQHQ